MKLAPIVLFVYSRPWHTQQTIEALLQNELASSSKLFVFSDGPKNDQDAPAVQDVREYVRGITGFASIQIVERDANWGLADNIVDGVTRIVNEFGKIIVLEDDLVTSPYFLRFMNDALDFYKGVPKVWHISGWNYPIDPEGLPDTFLWRVMNCWGWATWADRWLFYKKDSDYLIDHFDAKSIRDFNLDNSNNFWKQVINNKKGKINTWAIFWYATIFLNDGLCLNPTNTSVQNIGHDGSGTHCGDSGKYPAPKWTINHSFAFSTSMTESQPAVGRIKEYYKSQKKSLITRVLNKMGVLVFRRK